MSQKGVKKPVPFWRRFFVAARGGRRSRRRPVITHDSVNGRRRRTASAGGMERSGRSPPGPSPAGVHIHVTRTPWTTTRRAHRQGASEDPLRNRCRTPGKSACRYHKMWCRLFRPHLSGEDSNNLGTAPSHRKRTEHQAT